MSQQPLFNAASFVVFDSSSALVNQSFPYSRVAVLASLDRTIMHISMAVKTGYSDYSRLARVTLNGVQVGIIAPRPFVGASMEMEMVTIIVPSNKIPVPFDPITHLAVAVLQVVTTNADPDNWLLVGPIVCSFQVQGATFP